MKGRFRDGSAQNFLLKKSLFQGCKNLTIVPCSDWMGNFVKESFLKGKRIQVIHNGIDLDVFKTIITPGNDGKFRILAVSNVWSQSKGLYDIYRLRELLPLDSYEITMVGLTTQQVKNLPSGISGIQRTQNVQELVKLYAQSDVFINTTYADTFPTVNLEALACGTPVITYRTGGSPEAVTPETGKVVEQGNIQGMADAILSLQSQPLSRFACRQRAEQYFDKNKNFEQYIQLYESLLDKQ
jgi:glycosyltransferase involved in cell wall biosynthesis